jgi:hypothetical protein
LSGPDSSRRLSCGSRDGLPDGEVWHEAGLSPQRACSVLYPFPVIWGISDEDLIACEIARSIERQFAGEKVAPLLLPYRFAEEVTIRRAQKFIT